MKYLIVSYAGAKEGKPFLEQVDYGTNGNCTSDRNKAYCKHSRNSVENDVKLYREKYPELDLYVYPMLEDHEKLALQAARITLSHIYDALQDCHLPYWGDTLYADPDTAFATEYNILETERLLNRVRDASAAREFSVVA